MNRIILPNGDRVSFVDKPRKNGWVRKVVAGAGTGGVIPVHFDSLEAALQFSDPFFKRDTVSARTSGGAVRVFLAAEKEFWPEQL